MPNTVTFKQAIAFVDVMIGYGPAHYEGGDGEPRSPLVMAHLGGALGELPHVYRLTMHSHRDEHTRKSHAQFEPQSRAFIEYLEAVANALKWPGYDDPSKPIEKEAQG